VAFETARISLLSESLIRSDECDDAVLFSTKERINVTSS
jgi:hypothetical protein